jgi:hypothetical protein
MRVGVSLPMVNHTSANVRMSLLVHEAVGLPVSTPCDQPTTRQVSNEFSSKH